MASWKEQAWLAIDTETTGLDPIRHRIVELGAMRSVPDWGGIGYSWLLDPGIPIPPEATAVHGITDADVTGKPKLDDIAAGFLDLVRASPVLVGYNWPFDSAFLAAELGYVWWMAISGKPIIDPLVVVRFQDGVRPGSGSHKLEAVAERLGVVASADAHRALVDCEMTIGVLKKLLEHLPDDGERAASFIREQRARQDAQRPPLAPT